MREVVVRVLLLLIAVGAGGYAVVRRGDVAGCTAAGGQVFVVGLRSSGAVPRAELAVAVARLQQRCDDAEPLVAGVEAMISARHPALALDLAREATRRQPQDAGTWNALARAADAAGDGVLARTARRRVRRLSPFR